MIKFENTDVIGWEPAVRGMRNPMNSWEKSDSIFCKRTECANCECREDCGSEKLDYDIGPNDHNLMIKLRNAGTDHRKFMRMITVYVDITAPLYWWKEFDTYKVGTVANSCSTMHKIHEKEFTLEDFSCEHLIVASMLGFIKQLEYLNVCREAYLKTKDKKYWWQMIQLLPSSYNQKRTVMLNYEVLANIYKSRKNHKLDEWAEHEPCSIVNGDKVVRTIPNFYQGFCDWIKSLPYSELITCNNKDGNENESNL